VYYSKAYEIKEKLFSCTRGGIDAVVNVGSSADGNCRYFMNAKGRSYSKNSSRGLLRQNLTVSSNLDYYVKEQVQRLRLLQ